MKASRYNITFESNNKHFAFNAMSCALAEADDTFFYILNNLSEGPVDNSNELMKSMKEGSFIIDDNVDELDVLRFRSFLGKFADNRLALTILPNFTCNFACPYCYEGKSQTRANLEIMSNEIKEAIYKQVEISAKAKRNIGISWYGGEPTLSKDIIVEMSNKIIGICEKYGVEYTSSMTTNGYLFDDEFINKLADIKLKSIQITIDGPPEIHNKTRKLKNGQGTFDVIIDNIKKIVKKGIEVCIRANITKMNMNYFGELLDELSKQGINNCQVIPSAVVPYENAAESITDICLPSEDFAHKLLEFRQMMFDRKYQLYDFPYLPNLKQNYCYADNMSSYSIAPDGSIYKCWIDVGVPERSLGNIKDFGERDLVTAAENAPFYIFWSPFNYEKCVQCDILPMCMGGCPHRGIMNNNEPTCDLLKYCLIDALKVHCIQAHEYKGVQANC